MKRILFCLLVLLSACVKKETKELPCTNTWTLGGEEQVLKFTFIGSDNLCSFVSTSGTMISFVFHSGPVKNGAYRIVGENLSTRIGQGEVYILASTTDINVTGNSNGAERAMLWVTSDSGRIRLRCDYVPMALNNGKLTHLTADIRQ